MVCNISLSLSLVLISRAHTRTHTHTRTPRVSNKDMCCRSYEITLACNFIIKCNCITTQACVLDSNVSGHGQYYIAMMETTNKNEHPSHAFVGLPLRLAKSIAITHPRNDHLVSLKSHSALMAVPHTGAPHTHSPHICM